MTNTFKVKDNKGNIVFEHENGGTANTWAMTHTNANNDYYVYYNNGINVLHFYYGDVNNIWGTTKEVMMEWVR